MTDSASGLDPAEELLALARERRLDDLELAWMQRLEAPRIDPQPLYAVADYLVRRKLADQASLLLWSLIAAVAEKEGAAEAVQAAERAVRIAPEALSLREEYAQRLKVAHPGVTELDAILKASGLLSGAPPDSALDIIRKCLRLRAAAYVIHARSRRVGRMAGFQDGSFRIESEGAEQTISLDRVLADWEPLPADDFRAMAAFEPAKLRQLATDDPVRLVTLAVIACGGKAEFRQLKGLLIPTIIPVDGWSSWWNAIKVSLKRSPGLELSAGTQPVLSLRQGVHDFSARLLDTFAGLPDSWEKARCVLEYLGEVDAGHEAHEDLALELAARCVRAAEESKENAPSLALLAATAELRGRFPAVPDPTNLLAARFDAAGDLAAVIAQIPNEDVCRAVLNALKSVCPTDWPDRLARAFPAASLRLCEWIARELLRAERPELLDQAMRDTSAAPEGHTEALGWVWRRALSGEASPGLPDPVSLTVLMLDVMKRLARAPRHDERRSANRQLASKLRALISANDYKLMRALIAGSDVASAHRLHEAIRDNSGLTDEGRHDLTTILREHHPEEFIVTKPLWADDHIYSTAEGLARRQADLAKLVNEDIPRNAQAIGKAAALGDLRENWEYKSALEERDRLVERATRAKAELDRARVLDPSAISGEEGNVGVTLLVRHVETGREKTLTFLGPWDADIPRHIYSYLAPLSQAFMGRRVGDQVRATLDDIEGLFEIVRIQKAL